MIDLERSLGALLDGPLGPPAPIEQLARRARQRRTRRHRVIAAIVILFAVGAPVAFLVARNDPSDPTIRAAGSPPAAGAHFPAVSVVGDTMVMPLTLLDGTKLEVRGPMAVGLDVLEYRQSVSLHVPCASCLDQTMGLGLSVSRADRAREYAGRVPKVVGEGSNGAGVHAYTDANSEQGTFVYQFGPWMVEVSAPARGTNGLDRGDTALVVNNLVGETTPDGFLTLRAIPPLSLAHNEGPPVVLGGKSRHIGINPVDECSPTGWPPEPSVGQEGTNAGAVWCVPDQRVEVQLSGPPDWVTLTAGSLQVVRVDSDNGPATTLASTTLPTTTSSAPATSTPPPTTAVSATPDPDAAKAEIESVFLQWLTHARTVDDYVAVIEDGESLREATQVALDNVPGAREDYVGRVDGIELRGDTTAQVAYTVLYRGSPVLQTAGPAVKIDGRWLGSRETYCANIERGPARCPPRR